MSGQRSANSEGTAESVAAGCSLRELPRTRREPDHDSLLCFTWGRGEDGYVGVRCSLFWAFEVSGELTSFFNLISQLGLGDTSDQDTPTYVSNDGLWSFVFSLRVKRTLS